MKHERARKEKHISLYCHLIIFWLSGNDGDDDHDDDNDDVVNKIFSVPSLLFQCS